MMVSDFGNFGHVPDNRPYHFKFMEQEQYTKEIVEIDAIREANKVNRRLSRYLGERTGNAKSKFAEHVRQEIFDSKSQEEQQAILTDRKLLEEEFIVVGEDDVNDVKKQKPPMTDEYLISIGVDPNNMGSNKIPEGAKLIITNEVE